METKARLWNVNMSPKFSREVAVAIKGLPVGTARKFLEGVVEKRQLVELRRHNKEVAHHRGKPGRYPVKVARHFLKLLDNAMANARYLGAEEDSLRVDRVEVYRGTHKRPFGSKPLGKVRIRSRRASVMMILSDQKEDTAKKRTLAAKKASTGKKASKAKKVSKAEKPAAKKAPEKKVVEKTAGKKAPAKGGAQKKKAARADGGKKPAKKNLPREKKVKKK